MASSQSLGRTPRAALWRWGRRLLLCAGVGLVLVGLALWALLFNLDGPLVKRRVQALLRANVGFDIDYGATHVRLLSGLQIDDVVVRAAPGPGATSLELVRACTVAASWTPHSLLSRGPWLTLLALRGVELTLTMEDGDAVAPAPAKGAAAVPPPPVPPSRLLAAIFAGAPAVGSVSSEGVTVTLRQRKGGFLVEQWRLGGVALAAQAERSGPGWGLHVEAGSERAPLLLLLTRDHGEARLGEAELWLWLRAAASASGAQLTLDVKLARQTLVPTLRLTRILHLEGRFVPGAGTSEATLAQTELADGAASLEASVELSDTKGVAPTLRRARGVVDLVGALRLVPPDLLPASAQVARLRFDVAELVLAAVPRLAAAGHVAADATLAQVHATLGAAELALGGGRLTLKGELARDGGMEVQLSAPLQALRVATGGQVLSGMTAELKGSAHLGTAGMCSGTVSLRFDNIERTAAERMAGRSGELTVHTDSLQLDPEAPLSARGLLELRGRLDGVSFVRRGLHLEAEGIGVSAHSRLLGRPPYALTFDLPVSRLRLLGPGGRALLSQPARLGGELAEVFPNRAQPRRTPGEAKLHLDLGVLRAQLAVRKHPDALAFTLSSQAESLGLVRPFAARQSALGVPWERIGVSLDAKGGIDKLWSAAPLLHHQTQLAVQRPQFNSGGIPIAAQELKLSATSEGTLRHHSGEAELQFHSLAVGARQVGDGRLTLALTADTAAKTMRVRLGADAKHGPDVTLVATLGLDPGRRAITYDLDGKLTRLSPLRSLFAVAGSLQGLDLAALELGLGGRGTVSGLVEPTGPRGRLRLVPQPLVSLGVNGSLELRAQHLSWSDGDRAISTPRLLWKAAIAADGTQRKLHADLELGDLHVDLGNHQLDFIKVSDSLDLTMTGALAQGEAVLAHELTVGALRQSFAPGYAVGPLTFALQGRRSRDGVIRIAMLRLHNAAAGTTLNLRGGFDLGDERRSLSLRGTLEQRLASLWNVRTQYQGEGTMSLSLRLESGNLSLFRAACAVRMTDGNIRLPGYGITLESIDGEIPIAADLILDRRGVRLLRDAARNAYSELHFADQHSLLSQHSFISIGRVVTPLFTLAPLAGNLQINNNVASLSQLEMGLRGGRITGQSVLNFGEKDSAIKLHLRASNIEAGRGERFDGNAALVISAHDRSIDGRAEILRIGRGHLLELLDLHDPHHEDSAVNRVRRALSLGYPERVRLSFDHGFAAAAITFGGLAQLVRVDELRGIPTGPIIDKALFRLFSLKENGP